MGVFRKIQDNYLTTYEGGMSVDPKLVQQWMDHAQISGQPMHIPGGADPNRTMRDGLKDGAKEAKEFRKRISEELDAQKKAGLKPDEKKAKDTVRSKFKKFRKWK